jgi:TatD DNase family protein
VVGGVRGGAVVLIDSHAHLDDGAFDDDRAAVVARARAAGVRAIVNVGYNEARWATTAALCGDYPEVFAVLGLHPHEAEAWGEATAARLRQALGGPKVVGLGEIGLDFYRDYGPLSGRNWRSRERSICRS